MKGVKTHKNLDAWKNSIELVLTVYQLVKRFPESERFGLNTQIRRAAVSIPSNIAEGAARNSTKEFINYCYIALGSLSELETQLIIARRLEYFTKIDFDFNRIIRLQKLIQGLIRFLKIKLSRP